jgi:predicted MFS family arabinose efflux permease
MLYQFTLFVVGPIGAYAVEARGAQSAQRAITLVYAGFWAGTIFSPALGGWIGSAFGLRHVFGVAFVACVLSTLTVVFLRPQPVVRVAPGQARYRSLLGNRRFLGYLALAWAALVAMYVGLPFMPNFVEDVRGFDVAVVGVLGSVNSIGNVLANVFLGQRAPRRGFLLAQGVVALSMITLLWVPGAPGLGAAYFLRSGWFLSHSMAVAQVSRLVGEAERGLAFGLAETVIAVAQIAAPLIAGPLYGLGPALPFQACLALIALTVPLVWRFAPRADAVQVEAAGAAAEAAP